MSQVTDTTIMGSRNRQPAHLAFTWDEEGAALQRREDGSRLLMAPREQPPRVTDLMERIVDPDNMRRARKRVRSNKGAPGVDGMPVDDLTPYLVDAGPTLKASLLNGR